MYGNGSDAHNKYCGFRYIPETPSDPGEIVYFFFPMFIFKDGQIRTTAKVVLSDWFGLPDPDATSGGVDGSALEGPDLEREIPASGRIQEERVYGTGSR